MTMWANNFVTHGTVDTPQAATVATFPPSNGFGNSSPRVQLIISAPPIAVDNDETSLSVPPISFTKGLRFINNCPAIETV